MAEKNANETNQEPSILVAPPEDVIIPHIVTGRPPLNIQWCWIPPGPFTMGSDGDDATDDEKPVHTVELDGFWLARYPAATALYRRFIDAGGYQEARWWSDAGWQMIEDRAREELPEELRQFRYFIDAGGGQEARWSSDVGWQTVEPIGGEHLQFWADGRAQHPVFGVNWYEANAFARWAAEATGEPIGLPSEAQWEKAARGTDARTYPWGDDEPTHKLCNFDGNVGQTTPVGQYNPAGDGPYGNADLAGNVCEWTSSLLKSYPYDAGDGREDQVSDGRRVLRGGSWLFPRPVAGATYRCRNDPEFSLDLYGFRLVASVGSGS